MCLATSRDRLLEGVQAWLKEHAAAAKGGHGLCSPGTG